MKQTIIAVAIFITGLGIAGCASEPYTQRDRGQSARLDTTRMMKHQDIISLTKAGVSDSLIIGMMDATNTWFTLTTQDVLNLKNAGVSEKVIDAMMTPPEAVQNTTSSSRNVAPMYLYYGFYPFDIYPYYIGGYYRPHFFHYGFRYYPSHGFYRHFH